MCPETIVMARWVDGELTANEVATLEAHAATCARCRAEVAHLRGLRELPAVSDDPAFVGEVMARLDRWEPKQSRWPAIGALAAIAVVALLLAVTSGRPAGELQARGGVDVNGLDVTATVEDEGRQVVLGEGAVAVAPGFSVTARVVDRTTRPAWLMLFGVDAACEVHWLVPAWDDAQTDPIGQRFAGELPLVDLAEGLRPEVPPGRFTLVVAQSDGPRSVRAVESVMGRCGIERLHVLGMRTTTYPIEVRGER